MTLFLMEQDSRVRNSPCRTLESCLEAHDNAFYDWRYSIESGKFYPGPMMYVCISLLTILFPEDEFLVIRKYRKNEAPFLTLGQGADAPPRSGSSLRGSFANPSAELAVQFGCLLARIRINRGA